MRSGSNGSGPGGMTRTLAEGAADMRLAVLTLLLVLALDQASKWAIVVGLNLRERLVIEVLPPWVHFTMAWNRGVNFGLFASEAAFMRWFLIALALAISAAVWIWVRREGARPMMQVSAGLLIGGALGNALDRIVWGAVADFLNVTCCGIRNPYAFNVADVAIFAGAFGLLLFSGSRADTTKAP
jgi:signal peptidase II